MADDWRQDSTRRAKAARLNTTVPNPARVGDYLFGGRNNFEADRRAAWMLTTVAPVVGAIGPAGRAFGQRAVRYLAAETGIRQFLEIGIGLAISGSTHEVAQSVAPECRVVYADSDPMVLSHARALLLTSRPEGAVEALDADLSDPGAMLTGAAETLDLGRPVALLLMATLAFVPDDAAAAETLLALIGAVPAGSHVALYHQASDLDPRLVSAARRWNAMSDQRVTLRSRAQLEVLLSGLDLVSPGVVPVTEWRPAAGDPRFGQAVPVYGAVARKP